MSDLRLPQLSDGRPAGCPRVQGALPGARLHVPWLATDDSKYHRLVRLPPDRKQFILSNPDGTGRVVVRLEGEQDLPSTQIMLAVLGDMLRRGFKSTEVP